MWRLDSCCDQTPEICCVCQLAPQPLRDASVKKKILGSGRRNGTPVITEGWRNQRRYERNSESSLIGVSHDWQCWVHCSLNQSWRKRRCRRPLVINGAKWDSRLIIDETLRADMTVDGDRRERTSVRVGKNESGGDIRACSKLKWRPRKSRMREGCNICPNLLSIPVTEEVVGLVEYEEDSVLWMKHGWSSRPDMHGPGCLENVRDEQQELGSLWTLSEPLRDQMGEPWIGKLFRLQQTGSISWCWRVPGYDGKRPSDRSSLSTRWVEERLLSKTGFPSWMKGR